jgi:hypothetical protein
VRNVLAKYAHEKIGSIALQRGMLEAVRFKDETEVQALGKTLAHGVGASC